MVVNIHHHKENNMSEIDLSLLICVRDNETVRQMAKKIFRSIAATHERLCNLEANGYIVMPSKRRYRGRELTEKGKRCLLTM